MPSQKGWVTDLLLRSSAGARVGRGRPRTRDGHSRFEEPKAPRLVSAIFNLFFGAPACRVFPDHLITYLCTF